MNIRFPNIQPKQLGELVKSSTRKREIIQARFTICYFMKEILDLPLKSIGLILGKRDHSSIIHAISTYSDDVYTSSLNFKRHEDICQLLAVDNKIEQIKRNR
jgi:chromosomal replication initiator protein